MRFLIHSLLVAVLALSCSTAQRYNYTYGAGFNTGINYSGSREFGIHAKNGTYSLFTDGTFVPNVYGDAGVFIARPNSGQPVPQSGVTPNQKNPQQLQGFPQYNINAPPPYYNPNQLQVYPQNGQYYPPTPYYNPNQPQVLPQNGQNYPPSPYQRQFLPQPPMTPQFGQNFAIPPYNPYQLQGAPVYGQNYVGGYPYQNQGMQYGQNYGVPAYNPNQPQVVTKGSNALPNASNQTKTGPQ